MGSYVQQILRYTVLRTKANKSADLETILDLKQELDLELY